MHLISLEYHVLHYIKRIQIRNAIPYREFESWTRARRTVNEIVGNFNPSENNDTKIFFLFPCG